jgi:hypothetical protein
MPRAAPITIARAPSNDRERRRQRCKHAEESARELLRRHRRRDDGGHRADIRDCLVGVKGRRMTPHRGDHLIGRQS